MRTYVRPEAELISFGKKNVLTASSCICEYVGSTQVVDTTSPNYNPNCMSYSAGATEVYTNPQATAFPVTP